MSNKWLHIKPFITAGTFLLAGIVLIIRGFTGTVEPNMNNYALGAFGLLFLIVAIVTFAMYGALEKKYRNLLRDTPLLRYTLPADSHQAQTYRNIAELRMKNKAQLAVMLFFCVLFTIILPFFVEEKLLMAAICLGLGAFLWLTAWLITAYRARKMRRGGEEVILGRGGAFLGGSFHAWDMPDTALSDAAYEPPVGHGNLGELHIKYIAEAHPAPVTETVILQIPGELADRMPAVLQALKEASGG
jgi:hypothetical protein